MDYDTQLLKQYARTGSERAFRELVERQIHLVNSTALRSVAGDVHLARDVTQEVFTHLARKAASLPDSVVLGGWLHRHTCFTAAKTVRTEIRRRNRERTAMEIDAANENSPPEAHWQQLAPLLDDALNHLSAQDRDAIVLRYLQCRDLRSIGLALGTSEDAAQKRISRALEKLRAFLAGRGITFSSVMLSAAMDAGAATPVPIGLAATISAAALSRAATAKTALTALKTMITSKLSLTAAALVAVAGITAALITNHHSLAADPSAPASSPAITVVPSDAAQGVAAPPAHFTGVAQPPALAAQAQPAPASSSAPAGQSIATASVKIDEPDSALAPTESHSTSVQVFKGVVTTTTTDNGVVQTKTQPIPPSGVLSGTGAISSFAVSSGAAAASFFPIPAGKPISTRVNPDGSTTSTYASPQGGTTEVTVSADGKSRSMKTVSLGPASIP